MEPIHQAAWDGDVAAIDRLVAEDGERLNVQIEGNDEEVDDCLVSGCSPLMLAAWKGNDAAVARLVALGADAGLQSVRGSFATHWACSGGHSPSLASLFYAGASMTARNNHGRTPLMVAAAQGATDCVALLLLLRLGDGVGEQLGMVDNNEGSAAHLACWFNHPGCAARCRCFDGCAQRPGTDSAYGSG